MAETEKPRFGNIKDELFLISLIILSAGLIYTDAYFQVFGVKFESLDFSVTDIIYRGLIILPDYPSILVPYLLAIALLFFEIWAIKKNWTFFLDRRTPLAYILLLVILLLTFPLAKRAGQHQAGLDMTKQSSTLPVISTLESKSDTIPPMAGYRLLLIDKDFLYIFIPTDSPTAQTPIVNRVPKGNVTKLKTQIN